MEPAFIALLLGLYVIVLFIASYTAYRAGVTAGLLQATRLWLSAQQPACPGQMSPRQEGQQASCRQA